jgi:hypothetical protein
MFGAGMWLINHAASSEIAAKSAGDKNDLTPRLEFARGMSATPTDTKETKTEVYLNQDSGKELTRPPEQSELPYSRALGGPLMRG